MDTARDSDRRLQENTNRQSCCLQLASGRSTLDRQIGDALIVEVIGRRRNGELARARSNIEGEALHTYGAQEASAEALTMGLIFTGTI